MGADIRIWAQVGDFDRKIAFGSVDTIEMPYPGRNYVLYSLMAGSNFLRSDRKLPLPYPPRGIPEDDRLPREWDDDPHGETLYHPLDNYDHVSWLLPSELKHVIWQYESLEGRKAPTDILALSNFVSTYGDDRARILFGFSI